MKRKLLTAAAAMPIAFALSWGCINGMTTGLDLPVNDPGRLCLIWLACALAGSILFSFKTGEIPVSAGIIAAVYHLWNVGGISHPIRALITRLSIIYTRAYGWGVLEFAGVDWQTTSLDLLFAAWGGLVALCAAAAVIRGRGGLVAVSLSILPLAATMIVTDTPPDALPLFCQAIAVGLLLLTRSVARQDASQGAKLAALAALPTALALGAVLILCPKESYVNKAPDRLDAIVSWWQDTFVSPFRTNGIGEEFNPSPTASASTRLGSLGPRRVIPYEVMEVTADFDGVLYLRGQDYDKYDGMSWTATTDRVEALPSSPYFNHRGKVTVATKQPMAVQYIPSYQAKVQELTDGRLDNPDGLTEFEWSVSKLTGLNNIWTSYDVELSGFSHYLELPEATREWAEPLVEQIFLDKLISEGYDLESKDVHVDPTTGDVSIHVENYGVVAVRMNAAQIIVDYVANSARYSLNTPRMDSDAEDFARWFLEESDKGYCVHFATAATVLLRAAGIPARYVTGYMVNCEAGETVTVESDRAHAWVEYFDEDLRTWLVAEPTPPDFGEDEPETESVTAPPPVTQPLEKPTEAETTAPTRPTEPDATRPTGGNKPGKTEQNDPTAMRKILCGLLLAAVLWFIVVFQRLVRIALRRRSMAGGPNRRALGLWQDVARISAVLNREEPEELLELAQKAKFSQHKLTKEELRRFTAWLKEARRELNHRPLLQRLWCRYVLALW